MSVSITRAKLEKTCTELGINLSSRSKQYVATLQPQQHVNFSGLSASTKKKLSKKYGSAFKEQAKDSLLMYMIDKVGSQI